MRFNWGCGSEILLPACLAFCLGHATVEASAQSSALIAAKPQTSSPFISHGIPPLLLEVSDEEDMEVAIGVPVTYTVNLTNHCTEPYHDLELRCEWSLDAEWLGGGGAVHYEVMDEKCLAIIKMPELAPRTRHRLQVTLQYATPGDKRILCQLYVRDDPRPPVQETEATRIVESVVPPVLDPALRVRGVGSRLEVFDTPDPVEVRKPVTYTIHASGPELQEDVQISCVLPPNARAIRGDSWGGPARVRGQRVEFPTIRSIPPRKVEKLQLMVEFSQPGDMRMACS